MNDRTTEEWWTARLVKIEMSWHTHKEWNQKTTDCSEAEEMNWEVDSKEAVGDFSPQESSQ